jgi:hypothetical protein
MRLAAMPMALLAAAVLCCGCGVTTTRHWVREDVVQRQAVGPPRVDVLEAPGEAVLTITREVRVTEQPLERLYLEHHETYSTVDWHDVGFVFAVTLDVTLHVVYWTAGILLSVSYHGSSIHTAD